MMKRFNVLLLILMFTMLTLVTTVSAFEFDNVKSFDKIQNKISIDNMFGFGGTIVDYTLTSNTDYCLVDCSAEGIANLYSSGQLFQDINFKDKSGKDKEVSYKIYINDGVKTFDRNVPISYKEVCSDKTFINGSKECSLVPDKYEKQTVEETNWKEYKGEALLVGNYKWKIEGSKGEDQSVDWIASAFGKDLTEWAWWSSGYDDLLSYYKLDEITGTTAVDSYGSNNGTATNPALFSGAAVGIINQSTDFTAGDYYIDLGNTAFNFDTSVDTFGFSLWVKTATTGVTERFFGKDNATDKQYSLYFHFTDILKFNVYDSGLSTDMTLEYSTDIRDNNWHHIVITGNGTTNLMYVDNVLRDSDTGLVPSATTTNPTVIGTSATQYFSGYVDEVGIWNRTLSSTEVDNLWNGGLGLEFESPNEITTTSNAPVDYYNTTSNSITFNCSATDDVGILNLTLMIDGIDNNTVLGGVGQNLSLEVTRSLSEGSHNWSCRGTDGTGVGGDPKLSDTRFLKIDSTNPELNITYPTTAIPYWVSGNNLTINYTASDSNLDSCWYSFDLGATNNSISCGTNITQNITNIGQNNITLYANDSLGNVATDYQSWSYSIIENSKTFNSISYETMDEDYYINVSSNSSLTSVELNYNGTNYSMSNQGNNYWYYSLPLSSGLKGNNLVSFKFTYAGETINSQGDNYQYVNYTSFGLCNGTNTIPYINLTFKDESDFSVLNSTISLSSFEYYLGGGSVTKEYGFINTSENREYQFCSTPTDRTIYIDPYVQYASTGYPQRIYNPTYLTLTNTTTEKILFLLSSDDGLYVTFQVVNPSNQVLSGVEITASRTVDSEYVVVGRETTGASGTLVLWLNPDFQHDFNFSKDGFTTVSETFSPTSTEYTITMGGSTQYVASAVRGIEYTITPKNKSLVNDTSYDFGMVLDSNYWDLDVYGFNLRLLNGTIVGGESTTTSGTQLTETYNVGNQTKMYMDYYWSVNSTYVNYTLEWNVYNTGDTQWSIYYFVSDFKSYLSVGMFGLDNFGRNIIIFLILFITVGVMSFKYGLGNPVVISTLTFVTIFFLDFVLDLIPPLYLIQGHPINHLLTFISGLILILMIFRESQR